MLKKLMITTALSTLMIGAVAAQTPATSDKTTAPAATTAPANTTAPASANTAASAGDAKFINSQSPDQWLSSSFIGVDVIGPDEAKIGDVSDILFDKNGNVVGYIVGVGGFLGIGAKNVALAPSSFQVAPAASGTATTGSTSPAATSSDDVRLKLNMTKDQLQQAASFESKRDQDAKARSASQPAPGGGGMNRPAPK